MAGVYMPTGLATMILGLEYLLLPSSNMTKIMLKQHTKCRFLLQPDENVLYTTLAYLIKAGPLW